jgi:hypothetical protein
MKNLLSLALLFVALSLAAQQERPSRDAEGQQRAMQQALSAMLGGKNCEIDDSYRFNHSFTTQINTWSKKGKEEMRMKTRNMMDSKGETIGVEVLEMSNAEMPPSTIIMHPAKNQMITLINQAGSKMAMCLALDNPMLQQMGQDYSKDESKMSEWRKTGKTRSILGYTCEEWAAEDKQTDYSFWIAQNVDIPIDLFYRSVREQRNSPLSLGGLLVDKGMLMAMETSSKKNQERMTMEVVELKPSINTTVSTAGYTRF